MLANVYFLRRPGGRISLARPVGDGAIISDGDAIIEKLTAVNAALLIVDPFNHAHGLDDGNNNATIAKVAAEAMRIAHEGGAHRLRKAASGTADDLMDANSLRATLANEIQAYRNLSSATGVRV